MCGRFALSAPEPDLRRHFDVTVQVSLPPRYNIAPGQQIAILRPGSSGKELAMLRWGLIPFWAGDAGMGSRLINARAETLEEKSSFRVCFKRNRCLIPADGFYEWQEVPGRKKKQPYFVRRKDKELFAMAGLWSTWKNRATGEVVETCAIITTDANSLLAGIHNRMPAILPQERYDPWLNPHTGSGELKNMLMPFDAEAMTVYPVSELCNNPKNDFPECLKEIQR